jgi:hypothetical protein
MVGCLTVAVGAAIATGGSFLQLLQVTIRVDALHVVTLHDSYFATNRGKLVAGIAMAVFVVGLAASLRRAEGVLLPFVAGLGGVAVLAISIYDRIDVQDFVDTRAGARSGPALTVCMAGGVIILVGALVTVSYWPREARRARRQTSP